MASSNVLSQVVASPPQDCSPASAEPPIDRGFQRAIEWALSLQLTLGLVFMGVRYDWGWLAWGELALVGATGLATVLWLARLWFNRQLGLVLDWSYLLLGLGGLLVLLQLAHLPGTVLQLLSPGLGEHLPLWGAGPSDGSGWGPWRQASLAPYKTVVALRFYGLYLLTFFLVVQNVRSVEQVKRLLIAICLIGTATALFALGQAVFWNGRFFWFFQLPWGPTDRVVRGPFTNRNHFAGYMAMVAGPGLYCLFTLISSRRVDPSRRGEWAIPFVGLAFVCVVIAAFLSLSRGGIAATTIAVLIAGIGISCYGRSARQWLIMLILVSTLLGGVLGFTGTDQIGKRLATLGWTQIVEGRTGATRLELWTALLGAVPDFPALGAGIGAHEYVYRLYLDKHYPTVYTHAESSYLQLLVEGGVPALLLTLSATACLVIWCLRGLRQRSSEASLCAVPVAASLLAVSLHGLCDFVWHIPAHALLIAVLAGLALSLGRLAGPSTRAVFAVGPWRAAALTLAFAGLFVAWTPLSISTARASLCHTEFSRQYVDETGNVRELAPDTPRDSDGAELLTAALLHHPEHARYQYELGEWYRNLVLASAEYQATSMPLIQVRQTVRTGGFRSSEAVDDWLDAVLGRQNRHYLVWARRHYENAARNCCLYGQAYLRLAELSFLAPEPSAPAELLVRQAIDARPYDPNILYNAGIDLFAQQQESVAIDAWCRAAALSRDYRHRIVQQLVQYVPLESLLARFAPDVQTAMWMLQELYTDPSSPDQLKLLAYIQGMLLNDLTADYSFRCLARVCALLIEHGAEKEAEECIQAAVQARPYSFEWRLKLAKWLADRSRWDEARDHLNWCHYRDSSNPVVRNLRLAALKERIQRQTSTTTLSSQEQPELR